MRTLLKVVVLALAVFSIGKETFAQTSGGFPTNPRFNSVGIGATAPGTSGQLTLTGLLTGAKFGFSTTSVANISTYNLTTTNFTGNNQPQLTVAGNTIASIDLRDSAAAANQHIIRAQYTSAQFTLQTYLDNYSGGTPFLYANVTGAALVSDMTLVAPIVHLGFSGNPIITSNYGDFKVLASAGTQRFLVKGDGTGTTINDATTIGGATIINADLTVNSAATTALKGPTSNGVVLVDVNGVTLTSNNAKTININSATTLAITASSDANVTINAKTICLGDGTNCAATASSAGTFTATGVGFTAGITANGTWSKVGALTCVSIDTMTGTSNSTGFSITGLPATAFPAVDFKTLFGSQDNGVRNAALLDEATFTAAGAITLLHGLISNWSAGGTKTEYGIHACYRGV